MEYLGKGLGTIGIWSGTAFISQQLATTDFAPLIVAALIAAAIATVFIWIN